MCGEVKRSRLRTETLEKVGDEMTMLCRADLGKIGGSFILELVKQWP